MSHLKLYVCVLDQVPDQMVPVVVAHAVLGAHLRYNHLHGVYKDWLYGSFRKVIVTVTEEELAKVLNQDYDVYAGFESTILDKKLCVAVPLPTATKEYITFPLWKPSGKNYSAT